MLNLGAAVVGEGMVAVEDGEVEGDMEVAEDGEVVEDMVAVDGEDGEENDVPFQENP